MKSDSLKLTPFESSTTLEVIPALKLVCDLSVRHDTIELCAYSYTSVYDTQSTNTNYRLARSEDENDIDMC